MSYTYASFQKALASEMVVPNNNVLDPNFVLILPTIIDYAEQRCYRELDLLHAEATQWFPMTPAQRAQSIAVANATSSDQNPAQQILIVERVRIQPLSAVPHAASPPTGEPVLPVSVDFLDAVYTGVFPNAGPLGLPRFFALITDQLLAFGPAPDQAYTLQISGKARPVPLYNAAPADGTQTTFLTTVLPDLFLAAAMISASGYRHNFGAQADDPKMAVSWEMQYGELLSSAKNEETRKRFLGWNQMSSYSATQAAQPAPAPAG